ncbi:MAG: DUF4129 domain-containing protein [Actinomycetota bacterium]|nr:DUF4129 domain-containing protein [Actinomycetota bacterium]
MGKNSPSSLLLVALLVLGAAVVLPEGIALDPGGAERVVLPAAPPVLRYVIAALGAVVILTLVVLRFTVLRGEGDDRPPGATRWRYLALFLVILALWATFVAFRQEPVTRDEERSAIRPSPSAGARTDDDRADKIRTEFSESLGWAVTGIFVVGALAAGGVLFFLLRREEAGPTGRRPREAIAAEIEAGVDDLRAIVDPREAVIACYSRMEAVVEMSGVSHRRSDTPFELLGRLLREHDVLEPSASRLTELFEEAKFSINPIDEPMRQEALDALLDVRDQLRIGARVHEAVAG